MSIQFEWTNRYSSDIHKDIFPALSRTLDNFRSSCNCDNRIFDLGCGNGSTGYYLGTKGWNITGIDASHSGIAFASELNSSSNYHIGNVYDSLAAIYGQFPIVISLEVIEHLYDPKIYMKTLYDLLEPGGLAIISTPYHGYLKNLALALSNKLDSHFTVHWAGGHIKFWSIKTLTELATETSFDICKVYRLGRVPIFAKTMMFILQKQ